MLRLLKFRKIDSATQFYSQFDEDKHLYENYFNNYSVNNPVFLEIGALDGVKNSNTKFFEDNLNWTGILVEPHPITFESLKVNRPNCFTLNELVSDGIDEVEFRYFTESVLGVGGVSSTLPPSHFPTYFESEKPWMSTRGQAAKQFKPITLSKVIKYAGVNQIDFFSLDVEGHEFNVLNSYDWSVPIYLILIEMLRETEDKNEECRKLLREQGFTFSERFHINEIWINKNFGRPNEENGIGHKLGKYIKNIISSSSR